MSFIQLFSDICSGEGRRLAARSFDKFSEKEKRLSVRGCSGIPGFRYGPVASQFENYREDLIQQNLLLGEIMTSGVLITGPMPEPSNALDRWTSTRI
jgi:hypothetical protein